MSARAATGRTPRTTCTQSSGYDNVFSIGAINSVANSAVFAFNIGGISLHFGDTGIQGSPATQYNNGVFNGFSWLCHSFLLDDYVRATRILATAARSLTAFGMTPALSSRA